MVLIQHTKESSWVKYIRLRIKNNKNFLCFIGGPTGSGKSYSSLKIGELIDPGFNIDRVVFSGEEMMKLINSDELRKGDVIVFEEAGIEMNNRNWQSLTNKMINYLLQTFRHRCIILIFNSPYMDFVDAATRKLFHAEIVTNGIDFDKQCCILKPQLIQYNSRMKKFYYKYLRIYKKGVGVMPITKWRVGKPTKLLLEQYEKKKRAFTDKLNEEIQEQLKKKVEKKIRYPYHCNKCDYHWEARKKVVKQCPVCKNRGITLENQVLRGIEEDNPNNFPI